jgi:hypothetical protein
MRLSHSVVLGCALLVAAATANVAFAAAGDTKGKGKQVYVWHLDEGRGQEVKEAGGKGPVGKFTGDIQWADGVSGQAVQLSGTVAKPQFIAFAGDDHLDITEGLTLAAWIWMEALPQGGQENKGTIYFKNTYYLQVEPPNGNLAYYFYGTNPEGYHLSENKVKADRQWHHVAVTWDGSKVRWYIDGQKDPKEVNQTGPGRTTPAKAVYVGGESNACCPRFFQGRIDELAVANYALSDREIKDLISAALAVAPKGKLAVQWGRLKSGAR